MIRFSVPTHRRRVLLVGGALLFVLALAAAGAFLARSRAVTRVAESLLENKLSAAFGMRVELGGVDATGWDRASARSLRVVVALPDESPLRVMSPDANAVELSFERVDVGFQPVDLLQVGEAPTVLDGTIRLYGGRARLVRREGAGQGTSSLHPVAEGAEATSSESTSEAGAVLLLDGVEAVVRLDAAADRLSVERFEGRLLGAPVELTAPGAVFLSASRGIDLRFAILPVRLEQLWNAAHPQTDTSAGETPNPLRVLRFSEGRPADRILPSPADIAASRLAVPRRSSLPSLPAAAIETDPAATRSGTGAVSAAPVVAGRVSARSEGVDVDGQHLHRSSARTAAAEAPPLPGFVQGTVHVGGSIEQPAVTFDVRWAPSEEEEAAEADSVRVAGRVDSAGGVEVEVNGADVPLAAAATLFPGMPTWAGTVSFAGTLSGTVERPSFALDAALRPGGSADGIDEATAEIKLYIEGDIRGAQGTLDVPAGTLGLIAKAVPGVDVRSGAGSFAFRLVGDVRSPSLWGEGRLDGLSLRHPYVPEGIDGLDVHVELTGDRIVVTSSDGRSGKGRVRLEGEITDLFPGPARLALRAQTDELLINTPDFRTRVTGLLELTGPVRTPTVRGGVVLSDALLQFGTPLPAPRLEPADTFADAKGGAAVGPIAGGWDPALDVALTAGEDVRVRYPSIGLDVWATGALQVGGRLSAPTLSGVAEGTRGRLRYFGIRFVLDEGTARFAAYRGLVPELNVTAETHIEGATVLLRLYGEMDRLQSEVRSDPPMSESEILARIGHLDGMVGADGGYRLGWGDGGLVGAIWQAVRSYAAGGVEQAAAGLLAVDDFQLAGTLQRPEVRIGKYVGRNVYATYTLPVQQTGFGELGLEWRPELDWRLSLSVDSSGILEVGTEYRIRF